tara:strand:+ start:941 stop:1117 length:177 start_codon:yes stop_codon:yes gene_type:complete
MKQIKVLTNTEDKFNLSLNLMLSTGWALVGNITTTNLRGIIYYTVLIAEPNTKEDETK